MQSSRSQCGCKASPCGKKEIQHGRPRGLNNEELLLLEQQQPELYDQILEARNDPLEDLHIVEGDAMFRFQFTMQCSEKDVEKDREAPGL